MKKYTYTIIVLLFILCGCSHRLESWELKRAQEICKEHDGLDYINNVFGTSVMCQDGSHLSVTGKKIK